MKVGRVAALLFGSGFCALVYQIAWMREFRLVFGASTAATAAVLAVFAAGLGVGGLALGKRADRHARPLALYATLEIGIALGAAVSPLLLSLVRAVYLGLGGTTSLGAGGGTALRLVLSLFVLGAPTWLMGGTLPAAVRAVERDADAGRRSLGLLYGVNTLGAVTGCVLANFALLEIFGTRTTLWLAALVNLLVAVVARALARQADPIASDDELPAGGPAAAAPAAFVLASAGVVGFAFYLLEIVWYRMLAPMLGGSIFTFGLILAFALLGIGLGGAIWGARGEGRPATLSGFAASAALEALVVALPYALGDRLAVLAISLRTFGSAYGFAGHLLGWGIVTSIAVLPAAIVAGAQFPMLIALLGRGRRDVGRQTALAYAFNTAGAIVGSLAGGFGLVPALTAPGCWRLVAFVLAGLGASAAVVAIARGGRESSRIASLLRAIPVVGLAGLAFAATTARGPSAAWRHSPIGAGRVDAGDVAGAAAAQNFIRRERRGTIWQAEGVESSVALKASQGLAFVVNGKVDGNARGDAATQVMGGLVGSILHPAPKRSLVIGLGTGSTAGWLAKVPTMQSVDVVELEPAIVEVARRSAAVNERALDEPKLHLAIGDARELLLTQRASYDVVFSEPSNPYRAGIASLFTREYYEAVRDRLAEGGVFLQWVQAYDIDDATLGVIYATLASVFPDVETWELGPGDLLLVASRAAKPIDVAALRRRVSEEPYVRALPLAWRTRDAEGFLAHFIGRDELARAIAQRSGDQLNTDDQTLVEFGFARSVGTVGGVSGNEMRIAALALRAERPRLVGEVDFERVDDEVLGFDVAEGIAPKLPRLLSPAAAARRDSLALFQAGDSAGALAAWRTQARAPVTLTEEDAFARMLADVGDEAAMPFVDAVRKRSPAEADAWLALLRHREGHDDQAASALEAALGAYRHDPWPSMLAMGRAIELVGELAKQRPELALRLYGALREPFALRMHDERRTRALVTIAQSMDPRAACIDALHGLEPNVPWVGDVLSWRAQCYAKAGHPLAARAAAELGEFLSREPLPFSVWALEGR